MLLLNGVDNQIHEAQCAGETVTVELRGSAWCLLNGTIESARKIFLAAAIKAEPAAGKEHAAPAAQRTEVVVDGFLDPVADFIQCPCNNGLDLLPGKCDSFLPVGSGNLIGFAGGFNAVNKLALDILG